MAIAILVIVCILILAIIFVRNYYLISSSGGSSSSLDFRYYSDDRPYLDQTQYTQNGTFHGHMKVEGTSDTMLILLQDYNVTAFSYNGSLDKTHMIARNAYINESHVVTPTDTYNDTFYVTGIPDGFHDVEFVGFVDPYNYTGTSRLSDGPFTSSGVRFNVIVNNSTKVIPPYTDAKLSNDTIYSQNYPFGGPSLSKEPFSNQSWQRENVNGSSIVDYYVDLGSVTLNDNITGYSFAIVLLLDYKQIPIRAGTPDTVYYGHVDKNTSAAVHMSLVAPDEPGLHKLAVIVITDPYQNLEVAPYVIDNRTWTNNRDILATTTIEHQDINVL